MKKSPTEKLALRAQTIRLLTTEALDRVIGGIGGNAELPENGFIMRDTVIVRTSGRVQAPTEGGR